MTIRNNPFKEILSANKSATIKMSIADEGLAHLAITEGDFEIDYYLAEVETDV